MEEGREEREGGRERENGNGNGREGIKGKRKGGMKGGERGREGRSRWKQRKRREDVVVGAGKERTSLTGSERQRER